MKNPFKQDEELLEDESLEEEPKASKKRGDSRSNPDKTFKSHSDYDPA